MVPWAVGRREARGPTRSVGGGGRAEGGDAHAGLSRRAGAVVAQRRIGLTRRRARGRGTRTAAHSRRLHLIGPAPKGAGPFFLDLRRETRGPAGSAGGADAPKAHGESAFDVLRHIRKLSAHGSSPMRLCLGHLGRCRPSRRTCSTGYSTLVMRPEHLRVERLQPTAERRDDHSLRDGWATDRPAPTASRDAEDSLPLPLKTPDSRRAATRTS